MTWGNNSTFQILIIQGSQAITGLFLYNGLGAPGNPPQFAAVASGVTSDPFGNPIGNSKILVQGNVITEAGGIFRTAAAAPLIQLDGPHDAVLIYDAAGNLVESSAPVATSDGIGHAVLAGFTNYTTSAPFIATNIFNGNLQFFTAPAQGGPWTANGPLIDYTGISLSITSGTQSGAAQASLTMTSGATIQQASNGFGGPVILANEGTPSSGLSASASILFASNGHLKTVSTSTGGDGNTYATERLSANVASPGVLINSVAFTNIPQVFNVAAQKYRVDAMISIVTTFAAGAANLQVNGSATISDMSITYQNTVKSSSSSVNATRIQALATVIPSVTFSATEQYIRLKGFVSFSSAGTFAVQMSCTIAADTYTVITDSFVDLMPV